MSPDRLPFLASIVANPDDDLPRLVYADWLDENGDPDRAEFIRLQCERWRTREKRKYPQPMRERIRQIQPEHEASWRAELPPLPGVEWGRFWRGFVSEAKFASPAALVEQAAATFAATSVQMVQIQGLGTDSIDAVCQLPQLSTLYGLRLDEVALDLSLWRTLTSCGWFRRVRHLIANPNAVEADIYFHSTWNDAWLERNDEIVRMVLAAAAHEQSCMQVVHLPLIVSDEKPLQAIARNRIRLSGLSDSRFDPL